MIPETQLKKISLKMCLRYDTLDSIWKHNSFLKPSFESDFKETLQAPEMSVIIVQMYSVYLFFFSGLLVCSAGTLVKKTWMCL